MIQNNNENSKKAIATLGNGAIDLMLHTEAGGDIYLRERITIFH